jgi:hypothetical protein
MGLILLNDIDAFVVAKRERLCISQDGKCNENKAGYIVLKKHG